MNDETEDNYDISGLIKTINGGNVGDIWYDTNANSLTLNTGNGQSVISSAFGYNGISNEKHALTIKDGTIKIGELTMEVEQFETCLRHLLEITKQAKPEEFI